MNMSRYEALFTPLRVGSIEIKNRVVLTAMGGTEPILQREDRFEFHEKIVDYYLTRAKSNIGLIVPGVVRVWGIKNNVWLYDYPEIFTGPLKALVEKIHADGTKFFLQLGNEFGRSRSVPAELAGDAETLRVHYSSSDGIPNVWHPEFKHRAITVEEIDRLVEGFAKVAVLCKAAGVDGIELHAVHEGYLFDQLAIKNMNWRTDEYGGSLENRLRFTTRVIRAIKDACGEDYPVAVRYSVASKMRGFNQGAVPGENYTEFGRSLEESPAAARLLEAAGCDLLDADNGSYDSWFWSHPPVYMPLACNLPEVSYLKNFVSIPVVCAGRMEDPDTANAAVAGGRIDAVGVARQFLCDPDWLHKVCDGRAEDVRPCIACHNGCFAIGKIMTPGTGFEAGTCALNPLTKHEKKYPQTKAEASKKVAVVGGGVGGLELARVAALRGHKVTLYERSGELGGVFRAAAAPEFKEKDKLFLAWLIRQTRAAGVDIRLNTEVSPTLLNTLEADEIVLATGAAPRRLRLEGFEKGIEAVDYLLGRKPVGESVVVVGGGLTGCEIAYDLARQGKKPTVVEMLPDILQVPGLPAANENLLRELLRYYNVPIVTGASVSSIRDDGVVATVNGQETFIPGESTVLSVGYVPVDQSALTAGRSNVHLLGDAVQVKNLKYVIWSAWDLAYSL